MPVFDDVISILGEEMKAGLPGWDAQKRMVAPGRVKMDAEKIAAFNPRKSSVLVWLYPKENEVFTRLILRTQIGNVHKGQVAFPGGRYEETDIDLWQTALREASEEIGLPSDMVTKVGELSTVYIPPSNYWVHPFVGFSEKEITSVIDANEVERIINVNVQTLLDPNIKEEKLIYQSRLNTEAKTPYYSIQGYTVWGATAMILSELEALLRKVYKRVG